MSNELMNKSASPAAVSAANESVGLIWKVPVAVILGPFCALIAFIGEVVGDVGGFGAVGVCFLLAQCFLSRGLALRQSWPVLVGLNSLPLCLGIFVIVVEQKSGAWTQGVLLIVIGLICSLAGAILAARLSRERSHFA